ncbi:anti-sigma factor [Ilumatobacter sp.]|uniref:anti-sigma factor n=1 Tax=Ilumatobacter sp. TaxID=1967498 RepID=UPI003B52A706
MSDVGRTDELIALAALGELDADGWLELDDAIAQDPALATELDDALEVAGRIQESLATPPPAQMRDAVLTAVAATSQTPVWGPPGGETVDGRGSDVGTDPVADSAASTGRSADSLDSGRRPPPSDDRAEVVDLSAARRRRNGFLVAAAAAVVVLLMGVGALVIGRGGDDTSQLAAIEDADDAVSRPLRGDLGGTFTVVQSASERAVVVDGSQIPVPDRADRVYVLWSITDDGATPLGEFRPDDDGTVTVRIDEVAPGDSQLGITEETSGQVDTPTEPILATS